MMSTSLFTTDAAWRTVKMLSGLEVKGPGVWCRSDFGQSLPHSGTQFLNKEVTWIRWSFKGHLQNGLICDVRECKRNHRPHDTYTHARVRIHTHIHIQWHTHARIDTQRYIHAHMHAHMHTHMHKHTHKVSFLIHSLLHRLLSLPL